MHSLETRNLFCTEHNSSRILLQSFICPTIEGTPSVAPSSRELIPKNVVAARQSLPDWWPRWRPPVDWYHCRGREFLGRFYAAARVHHPTSNLNTESARLSRRRREKEKRRGSDKARERPERGSKKVGQKNGGEEKRREREAEGCTGFVGYVGPGNSGTEPSSSPSLSGILIIRAGSLRGEQPGQGCSAAGLLFASCPVLRGYRPPTACSSRVPFSLSPSLFASPALHSQPSPPLLSRRIHSLSGPFPRCEQGVDVVRGTPFPEGSMEKLLSILFQSFFFVAWKSARFFSSQIYRFSGEERAKKRE